MSTIEMDELRECAKRRSDQLGRLINAMHAIISLRDKPCDKFSCPRLSDAIIIAQDALNTYAKKKD